MPTLLNSTPDTEKLLLKAVNVLLRSIGEIGIRTEADYDVLVEAFEAKETIQEVTDAVLAEGWDFNTDTGYKLALTSSGIIPIPYNVLEVSSDDGDLIMREWRLYSKKNNSTIFTEPQVVNIVWNIPFNEMTHALRHYITIRAALIFGARMIGDTSAFQFTKDDELKAYYAAKHNELRTSNLNMLNGSFGQSVNTRGL